MELKLLEENNNILTWPSSDWDFEVDGDPTELVDGLFKALTDNGGVGLAAPQVGIIKRIFVMGNFTKMVACINPIVISSSSELESDLEGCLSFPELYLRVKRPKSCNVRYQNVKGEYIEEELNGFIARVFLHEYDHLYGITFDNRVGDLALKMAKDRRKKFQKKLTRLNA